MLAVKLHKDKKPWLGKGSYLIPIVSWELDRIRVKSWLHILDADAKRGWVPKTKTRYRYPIRYITLVKIPDDHPVCLYLSWLERQLLGREMEFKPLRDIPRERKEKLLKSNSWGPSHYEPELILGAPLPESCIIWKKDIRLLFEGDRRSKLKERYREEDG